MLLRDPLPREPSLYSCSPAARIFQPSDIRNPHRLERRRGRRARVLGLPPAIRPHRAPGFPGKPAGEANGIGMAIAAVVAALIASKGLATLSPPVIQRYQAQR